MSVIGIIAEYNPFHNGHAYQIREARRLACTGSGRAPACAAAQDNPTAHSVIAVMSPCFVQRGAPAAADVYVRTRMALEGGCDLVLELPQVYACASSRDFAAGGVSLLHALGCVDCLSFGVETDCTDALSALSLILAKEPAGFSRRLKDLQKNGRSYPAAREEALRKELEEDPGPYEELLEQHARETAASKTLCAAELAGRIQSGLLRLPNNILALEYLSCLRKLQSSIRPLPVRRLDNGYHSKDSKNGFCSAEAIRTALRGQEMAPLSLEDVMPEPAHGLLLRSLKENGLPDEKRYDILLHYALMHAEDPAGCRDVPAFLADRIRRYLPEYETADSFAGLVKSRQITRSHVDRALLNIFLGNRRELFLPSVPYARILGFRRESTALLHRIASSGSIPLIAKNADAGRFLDGLAMELFLQDLHCEELYQLLLPGQKKIRSGFTRSPIVI